jgi:hypothetical protein
MGQNYMLVKKLIYPNRDLGADRNITIITCVEDWPPLSVDDETFENSIRGILYHWIIKYGLEYICHNPVILINNTIDSLKSEYKDTSPDNPIYEWKLRIINSEVQTIWLELDNKIFEQLKK